MIETRLLYYFLAVAREQNITKAAEVLHITQPSLSKQMYDLEDRLGKKLLIRGNKSTTLTEDGAYFRGKAEEIVQLMENTISSFDVSDTISGTISLGCAETEKMSIITKALKKITVNYNKITFKIHSGNANDVLERLDKGLLDVGLLINPAFNDRYDYLKMPFYDVFGLLVNTNSPLAKKERIEPKDILNTPLLMSSQEHGTAVIESWLNKSMNELNIKAYYNLIYNATHMVEQEIGSALCISDLVNCAECRNLKFIPLYPELKAELYIVTKKYQNKSKALELFLNEIKNVITSN